MEPITYGTKQFNSQKEMFDFLFKNKKQLIAQKKAVTKFTDCITIDPMIIHDKSLKTEKSEQSIEVVLPETLRVVVIINTTNFMDCHDDVHLPGIWTKSLSENKMIMHVQEHEMEFEKIISDGKNLKAYARTYTWEELGYPYEGVTEGLTFDSTIEKKRNEFMLNQYKNGWVRNHSVGMRYVKFDMAINDEDYPNEFAAWNTYFPQIANKERADEKGYFWYVIEAKCIEGSAVPMGSNSATPTLVVESADNGTVICESCGNKFDYNTVEEAGMGYVLCPECNSPVTQSMKSMPKNPNKKKTILGEIDFTGLIDLIKSERAAN